MISGERSSQRSRDRQCRNLNWPTTRGFRPYQLCSPCSLWCRSRPPSGWRSKRLFALSSDDYKISVNVGPVVLPVTVTDRKGAFVPDSSQRDFRVYETGRLQQITSFQPEDVPVTVGLVVDNSGSTGPKRPVVIAASLAFVRSSNSQDQMFVVNFNQTVTLGLPESIPFTSDQQQLREALSKLPRSGNTALYDAIAAALQHLKAGARDRKALIVVTDGGDNASQIKIPDLIKMAGRVPTPLSTLSAFLTKADRMRILTCPSGSRS